MKKTKVSKQIPTIMISKNLISELCAVLEKEYIPSQKDDPYGLSYSFDNKNVSISENENEKFVDNLPNEIGDINLSSTDTKGKIAIAIRSNKYYDWNKFSVSGEDATWVYGISKRIEGIFEKYKTNNHLFYTKKSYFVYLLCSVGLFFTIFLPLFVSITDDKGQPLTGSWIMLAGAISGNASTFLWPPIFHRIFPILEIEKSKQSKLKGVIMGIIIGVISSIIASALFLLIQSHLKL
jgi:hypothetical protein